ncbi:MAG: MBL fold metallo-hydrolase [Proteobacteria bacterium]|nr:MBL fold metallo-hydrolase [Pseudomonadota bacterium]
MVNNEASLKECTDTEHGISVCMLASGSKGNAIYISNGSTTILIDAGLSGVELQRRMASRNISPGDIDAIIVTHEHADHIAGVGVLSRRFDLPVYISAKTMAAASTRLGKLKTVVNFDCGSSFDIKTLKCHPFSISHDAQEPSGFTIQHNGFKLGIATDLGIATGVVKTHLAKCNLIVLEANHDPEMLIKGSYPWPLKQRIKGRTGHLSNEDTRNLVSEIRHDGLSEIILAHLSEENNTPEKAVSMVGQALNNTRTRLSLATQDECGKIVRLE